MGKVRRYRTALSRHHRSRGFGIHSPHAYDFVVNVLRQRLPYYNYDYLTSLRRSVISEASSRWPHPRVISAKNAKLLFRITNRFNPRNILQIGTTYGISTASMMSVSSSSHLYLYEPQIAERPIAVRVFKPYLDDVDVYNQLSVALDEYKATTPDAAFVLVNDVRDEGELEMLSRYFANLVNGGAGVVVIRNIARNNRVRRLWNNVKSAVKHGQTFNNDKIAIIIANPKLTLQHFFVWF